jgi:hypothetical protein
MIAGHGVCSESCVGDDFNEEREMAHEQRKKRARRLRHKEREPARARRPSLEELGGISEYQVQSASTIEDGDPLTDLVGIPSAVPRGGPPSEELSVAPDELGANFLRGAVQDPRPEEAAEDEEFPLADSEQLPSGEERMIAGRLGAFEHEGPLITELPERSGEEGELSELTHQAAKEIRTPRRGDRIRDQARRVAELRADLKSEYLGRQRKRGPGAAKR